MRKVILHGQAGVLFGKEFELEVANVVEAMRALGSQIKGFRNYIAQRHFRIVVGKAYRSGHVLDASELTTKFDKGDIHVMPMLEGAKRGNPLIKIIAGVLIAAVAWWAAPAAAAGGMGASLLGGVTYGQVALMGLGLAATGLSQLLTQQDEEKKKEDSSFSISGAINVSEQGGPVALIYGRYRVGTTIISSGVTTDDIAIED